VKFFMSLLRIMPQRRNDNRDYSSILSNSPALDRGEWPASRSSHFTHEGAKVATEWKVGGPQRYGQGDGEKNIYLRGESNSPPSIVQLVT
jgi:hypothetical protein